MNISFWIMGIVLVGVAWVFNLIANVRLGSGDIDSGTSLQRLATTFNSLGFGWLIGQTINYFIK